MQIETAQEKDKKHGKINITKIQEAHLCQAQEGTMYKIKTSLDYLEQIQKNSKRCREK